MIGKLSKEELVKFAVPLTKVILSQSATRATCGAWKQL